MYVRISERTSAHVLLLNVFLKSAAGLTSGRIHLAAALAGSIAEENQANNK